MKEREKARELILTHGTNSPFEIAAQKNIVVLYEDLGKNIWGYFTCTNRIPCIHINNRLNYMRALFTGAHELAHGILHPSINTPFLRRNTLFSVDKLERQANRFAIHLLIGLKEPEAGETRQQFLFRCGIPELFHDFY
ncbi:ImmA/IrrE family metallo-endopeptidase [Paenibacillus ehimensis]|uniref:ImmA/IrrE family metallo-endopeptidase n=1 Tax=Paenibacillus ehimensis TaxID=79264 RepID=UPI003D2AA4E1